MVDCFIIREKPLIKFELSGHSFTILNENNKNDEGDYSYEGIKSVKFTEEGSNWLVSALVILPNIIFQNGLFDI